jgi:hypothetical protein
MVRLTVVEFGVFPEDPLHMLVSETEAVGTSIPPPTVAEEPSRGRQITQSRAAAKAKHVADLARTIDINVPFV